MLPLCSADEEFREDLESLPEPLCTRAGPSRSPSIVLSIRVPCCQGHSPLHSHSSHSGPSQAFPWPSGSHCPCHTAPPDPLKQPPPSGRDHFCPRVGTGPSKSCQCQSKSCGEDKLHEERSSNRLSNSESITRFQTGLKHIG